MNIVFPHENLHVLCGAVRVLFAVADICKKLGHNVTVIGDKHAAEPVPGATVTRHYEIDQIGDYYPLKSLKSGDVEKINMYGANAAQRYLDSDLLWSFSGLADRIEHHVSRPAGNADPDAFQLNNHWSYQHFPVAGDYPHPSCLLYANSTYTQAAIKARWGKESRLLHPPIPVEEYNPDVPYEERSVDLIYVGRVDPLKLGSPPVLGRFPDLNTVAVGSHNEGMHPQYNPDVRWVKNADFSQLTEQLSRSKVYVHWKGLFDRVPEHFGIVVAEAMASGVPTVVPRMGGPWSDISSLGRYCIGVDSVAQAEEEVRKLLGDREYWDVWHDMAVKGVERFGYACAEEKLKTWLDRLYTEDV